MARKLPKARWAKMSTIKVPEQLELLEDAEITYHDPAGLSDAELARWVLEHSGGRLPEQADRDLLFKIGTGCAVTRQERERLFELHTIVGARNSFSSTARPAKAIQSIPAGADEHSGKANWHETERSGAENREISALSGHVTAKAEIMNRLLRCLVSAAASSPGA